MSMEILVNKIVMLYNLMSEETISESKIDCRDSENCNNFAARK